MSSLPSNETFRWKASLKSNASYTRSIIVGDVILTLPDHNSDVKRNSVSSSDSEKSEC